MSENEKCPICGDDGWTQDFVELGDELGDAERIVEAECPRLHDPGHAPFNATGLLPDSSSRSGGGSE